MASYDCIVAGVGGAGSATVYHLARRGCRVLGIDAFPPGHDRGSSHGHTRLIRRAYHEHPSYVPLILRAYDLWAELEAMTGESLYRETGIALIGPPDGEVVPGFKLSAREHSLPVEELDTAELASRFPALRVDEGCTAMFEARAGFLYVEECVRAHARVASEAGAELLVGERVTGWSVEGNGVRVRTTSGEHTAAKLVVTAGAWAADLLRDLKVPLQVLRKPVFWYATRDETMQASRGCPSYLYEVRGGPPGREGGGLFYGFPQIDSRGVKVAEHSSGDTVGDPLQVRREVDARDREPVEWFRETYLPATLPRREDAAVCLYTLSPDRRFILDRHPGAPQVALAAGLSGHGFKFTSVLGVALADLTLEGTTDLPIEFLSLGRFT